MQVSQSDQTLLLSLEPRYLIKRIDEDDIEIGVKERDLVLKALEINARFVKLGEYVLMLNAIKSIDPKYGPQNIPPRPAPKYLSEPSSISSTGAAYDSSGEKMIPINQKLIEQWDKLYDSKLLP